MCAVCAVFEHIYYTMHRIEQKSYNGTAHTRIRPAICNKTAIVQHAYILLDS